MIGGKQLVEVERGVRSKNEIRLKVLIRRHHTGHRYVLKVAQRVPGRAGAFNALDVATLADALVRLVRALHVPLEHVAAGKTATADAALEQLSRRVTRLHVDVEGGTANEVFPAQVAGERLLVRMTFLVVDQVM